MFPGAVGPQRAVSSQEQWGLRVIKGFRTKENNTQGERGKSQNGGFPGEVRTKEDLRAARRRTIKGHSLGFKDSGISRKVSVLCTGQQGLKTVCSHLFLPTLM